MHLIDIINIYIYIYVCVCARVSVQGACSWKNIFGGPQGCKILYLILSATFQHVKQPTKQPIKAPFFLRSLTKSAPATSYLGLQGTLIASFESEAADLVDFSEFFEEPKNLATVAKAILSKTWENLTAN